MRCQRVPVNPALFGPSRLKIAHRLGAAKQPDGTVTRRLTRQRTLIRAENWHLTLVGGNQFHLRPRGRNFSGEPVPTTASSQLLTIDCVGTAHNQHAIRCAHLWRYDLP
jgi:hypothetical protein